VIPAPESEAGTADTGHPAENQEPAIFPTPEEPATAEAPAITEAPAIAAESPSEKNEFAGLFDAVSADHSSGSGAGSAVEVPADEGAMPEVGSSGIGNVVANEPADDFANDYDSAGVADNPTAQLVARLWAEREHGGKFEIHVTGGGVILPQWYEPRWSRGTHGLFANQAADGTVTLTAVAWESVQKIVVRQVEGLPDGMFE
jgi:hypothetical protein